MERIFAPDIRTIFLCNLLISTISVLVLLVLWLQNRKRYTGIGFWIACFSFQFVAMILIVLRTIVPDWASYVLSYTLIITGMFFSLMGYERFVGKVRNQRINLLLILCYILAQIWFTYFHNSLANRRLFFAFAFAVFSAQSLWLLVSGTRGEMRKLVYSSVWILAAFCFISFLEVFRFFTGSTSSNDLFQADRWATIIVFAYQVVFLLMVFVLVLMYNKRVLLDISLQERKYNIAFQSSPYGILFTKLSDGKIIDVNDGFLKISGFTYPEVIGKSTPEIRFWENDDSRSDFIAELLLKNLMRERELLFRRKSGDIFTALVSSEIIMLNKEKYILSSINDISDRKAAEKLLTARMYELQVFNRFMVGRENRMIELKKEINSLCLKSGLQPRYLSPENESSLSEEITGGISDNPGQEIIDSHVIRMASINLIEDLSKEIERRKLAEESITKTERYFRSLIEKSSDGVVLIGKSGEMTYASPSAKRIFGYSQTETRLPDPDRGTHPDDLPRVIDTINKIVGDPALILTIEYRFMKNDMTYIWIESTFTNLFAEPGVESIVINFRDITERKKGEAVLFQRLDLQDQLSKIAVTVPGMIFSFNMRSDGSFCMPFCTPVIKDLWGFFPEELKKDFSPAFERIHPADKDHVFESITASARNLNPWRDTFRVNHPLKGELWLEGSSMPRHEQDGSILWYGYVQDVTVRKHDEVAIKQLNADLEKRVAERTVQLENALKELESFSYSVSHDLIAPLRTIHSFTKLLQEDYGNSLDNEGNRICGVIETSALHMGQLIDDLLEFSKISRAELTRSKIDMNILINSVFNEITIPAARDKIKFIIPDLPAAFGDLPTLKQVIINLISNAVKYSSKVEKPVIEAGCQIVDGEIIYFIRDNGVGFDMEFVHKLFGVFQRLHSATEFEGNGVGLAIVQRVIKRHRGRTWAEGYPGNGATFYFSLPQPVN